MYSSPSSAVWRIRAQLSLIVIPRSRSMSIVSHTWSCISRSASVPVFCSSRSASVDLPWSMCAMMQKLRILSGS